MKRAFCIVFYAIVFIVLYMLATAPRACGDEFATSILRGAGATVWQLKYSHDGIWYPYFLSQVRSRPAYWMREDSLLKERRDDFSWGAGVDYKLFDGKKADFSFGLVWLAATNRMNGTNLNSHFELSYDLSPEIGITVSHISHGSKFGIEPNKPNRGWNFVGIGLKWRF